MKKKEKEKPTAKEAVSKKTGKKKKIRKNARLNKKQLNNKVLKAKEILAKNREALKAEKEEKHHLQEPPKHRRTLRIVRKTFFGVLMAVIAVLIISFVVIRFSGGTPTIFGYSIQRITSGSMEPELHVGDIILSKSVSSPEEIKVNDIITFQGGAQFENASVTHRVVIPPMRSNDGEYVLTTKGDANERMDDEISFSDVRSVFQRKIDFLNDFYNFFLSPLGLLVFIAVLAIIFFDEILTLAKILTGSYVEEEDEDFSEIMDRIKQEEEEQKRLEEERREYKRKNPRKFDNTSNKKKKNRKKQAQKPAGSKPKKKQSSRSKKKPSKKSAKK